jgi:hypothetical protein
MFSFNIVTRTLIAVVVAIAPAQGQPVVSLPLLDIDCFMYNL